MRGSIRKRGSTYTYWLDIGPDPVTGKRRPARCHEALAGTGLELIQAVVEAFNDLLRQFLFLLAHSFIPCLLSVTERAWVAREQCVFTLPSEHPIIFAASATSSSSQ